MLTPEQAREELNKLRASDWVKRVDKRLDRLPESQRAATRTLVGLAKGSSDHILRHASHFHQTEEAVRQLDEMTDENRLSVFADIFPKLAPHIERCWQAMKSESYTRGYLATPFRAPSHPEDTRVVRGDWLRSISIALDSLDQDAEWVAAWAPYLATYKPNDLGRLLAAVIDGGGDEGERVMQTLIDSANGDHEVGQMGRHVTNALMCCNRPDAWEYIEKLLLAAQRQEGLRQVVLETIDRAHPQAFRRMLRLILDEDLTRFASVVRAADVWFALRWDSASSNAIKSIIETVVHFMDDPDALHAALDGKDPEKAYFALWTLACEDAYTALDEATKLLKHAQPDMRFAGVWMLYMLALEDGHKALILCLEDEDLRLAGIALNVHMTWANIDLGDTDLFAKLDALVNRLGKKRDKLKPIIWPWMELSIARTDVADIIAQFARDEHWPRMLQIVPEMSPIGREQFVKKLTKSQLALDGTRDLLLKLIGDPSSGVRLKALGQLDKIDQVTDDYDRLEALLTRKAGDLRRGVYSLLRKQEDPGVLASIDRLLAAKNKQQRLAGVELMSSLNSRKRLLDECRQRAENYIASAKKLDDAEQNMLDNVMGMKRDKPTLNNALGLMDSSRFTQSVPMKDHKAVLGTPAAVRYFKALDDLIHRYRETTVKVDRWDGEKEELLGNASGLWRYHDGQPKEPGGGFPLKDVWQKWYDERPNTLRDKDGLDALRAAVLFSFYNYGGNLRDAQGLDFFLGKKAKAINIDKLRYIGTQISVLDWLVRENTPDAINYILDAAETSLARVPAERPLPCLRHSISAYTAWLERATAEFDRHPEAWNDEQITRLIRMHQWMDRPIDAKGRPLITEKGIKKEVELQKKMAEADTNSFNRYWYPTDYDIRKPLASTILAQGLRLGVLNEHDAYDVLVGGGSTGSRGHSYRGGFTHLRELTGRKPHKALSQCPGLAQLVERFRDRILEVELVRGDEPTAATVPASVIGSVPGVEYLVKLLKSLGKTAFLRGYSYSHYNSDGRDKKSSFSQLIRRCYPLPEDTAERFKELAKAAEIPEGRWVELAMFAPQWSKIVGEALSWNGFEDAVWWLHAHTKDDQWSVEQEVREAWAREISERTALEARDLVDGAVDVEWFRRTYDAIKKKRWAEVYAAAKNASSAGGHKRAQLFADAMLGQITKTELVKRVKGKRDKDAARALGLLPLARGKVRQGDLLKRYELLQEFLRTSKQFGSMRQASEKRAVEIGQANLARTAGYPDPLRLQWAMEASAVHDLAEGPVSVTVGPTTVSLQINDAGEPEITVEKEGKALKTIPAAAKKDRKVKELRDRRTVLKRQMSRMRLSLEQMMCRGERFTGDELAGLMRHPLMKPMLERLVFIGEGIAGYPCKGGRLLVDHRGAQEPVKKSESMHLAHPHDLLIRGDWSRWQHDCFAAERVQPFKQIFRELYVLTDTERNDETLSNRYAGQQVNPRQAMALLGSRGWISLPGEGVRKTYHDQQLSVWIEFQEYFHTPAEVDGLTLENVRFSKAGEWKPVKLNEVSPLTFSEVMRDLDLVVSVAHRGGVDPEASASTIEMRSDLLRETLAVLDVDNIRIEKNHALIKGEHASYTLHLGSAVTHVMPGGSLFIVPVHSQHRGRLFLPFADDDPKTAEVISKALLLARDKQIKDPNILDQIRLLS